MGIESLGQRITIKRIISFLLTLSFLLVSSNNVLAYESAQEHNELMNGFLFGNYNIISKDGTEKREALEKAVALTLDQENGTGQSKLDFLNNSFKVKGIVKSISKINIAPFTHRRLHVEWENGIDKSNKKLRTIWELRKRILKNTVKKVFSYNNLEDAKCNVMSSIIYYIHILGDYFEIAQDENKYEKYRNGDYKEVPVFDLYSEGRTNNYLLKALKQNFITLFSFQKNNYAYSSLINFDWEEIETDFMY